MQIEIQVLIDKFSQKLAQAEAKNVLLEAQVEALQAEKEDKGEDK
ncbi:hypothetical protein [Liquorilactobacillus cacaonum]|nr:hypothetical protein [Liquorilactobacillus cacaonum]